MIKHEQEFTPEELRQLDLLVDGELADAARRQLLTTLEARPDGWRRLALAFLEAQSWGSGLRSFAAPQKPVASDPGTAKPTSEISAGPVVEFHPRRSGASRACRRRGRWPPRFCWRSAWHG